MPCDRDTIEEKLEQVLAARGRTWEGEKLRDAIFSGSDGA